MSPWYNPFRIQVDPQFPAPRQDIRWVLIVLGIALIIASVMLLAISALLESVLSSGVAGCSPSPCGGLDIGAWFVWLGAPLLVLGIVLAGIGIWWGLR